MVQGRTQRPELNSEFCGTCRICLSGCPGRVFRDLAAEPDTIRGKLAANDLKPEEQPPCRAACPLAQDIPQYLKCIAEGDAEAALGWILRDNPFPAVLGHVCHHPCEQACISGSIRHAPAMRELKRFASMATRPEVKIHPGPSRGNVAIIGAGPAGLAASWTLSREGIRTVAYDQLPVAGGLLSWAIPPFRLPRKAVQEDVNYILQHGVDLRLNRVFYPKDTAALRSHYDAVLLACGAPTPRETDIPGSRFPGIWMGLEFLHQAAFGPTPEITPPVVVIGGGNVATDAARWARRLASPVTIIYRRDQEDMPAYAEEIEASASEGIEFVFRSAPVAFEGDPGEGVRQIRIQSTRPGMHDAAGRRSFEAISGTEKFIAAGTVILALGQEKGLGKWLDALGIKDSADSGHLTDRIYATGDMITGPATVVEAVAGGINSARRIIEEVFG